LSPEGKSGHTYELIDRDRPPAPYLQLAALIRKRGPGKLPSILKLAEEYEVSVPTVRKALDVLKAEGVVEAVAGLGTFIAHSS
jgi:DNA-binding GntR family transcriptional regulator